MSTVLFIQTEERQVRRLDQELGAHGIAVSGAPCVCSALEFCLTKHVDLIVADVHLPVLSVLDLLELKRLDKRLSTIPVVVLGSGTRHRAALFEAGCADFIQLPIDPAELALQLKAKLNTQQHGGLYGDLSQISLLDLLQMLVAALRSGTLLVELERSYGTIGFKEGQIVYADDGKESGEAALLGLLRNSQHGGRFHFSGEETKVAPNIDRRTDHLLLNLASRLDEEPK